MHAEELTRSQLRLLSHPTRLAFLQHLRERGPATSRALGREFEMDSGAASYHLRRLAAGGLIIEDPALGTLRKWWYVESVALLTAAELRRVAATVPTVDSAWLSESSFIDQRLVVDAERRQRLRDELMGVIEKYREQAPHEAGELTQVRFQIFEQP